MIVARSQGTCQDRGSECGADATRDFRSRQLDTFLPNFVVLWQ
jgi:hypothetical protein